MLLSKNHQEKSPWRQDSVVFWGNSVYEQFYSYSTLPMYKFIHSCVLGPGVDDALYCPSIFEELTFPRFPKVALQKLEESGSIYILWLARMRKLPSMYEQQLVTEMNAHGSS